MTRGPEPFYTDDSVTIWHGDAELVLPLIPEGSVGAVVTDPPYAVRRAKVETCIRCGNCDALEGWTTCSDCLTDDAAPRPRFEMLGTLSANYTKKATHSRGFADHDSAAYIEMMTEIARGCAAAARPGAHLFSFGHGRTLHEQAGAWTAAGFEIQNVITWEHSPSWAKAPSSLVQMSELILLGRLSGREPMKLPDLGGLGTVIRVPKERHGLPHPSVKPLSLMVRLVDAVARKGMPVLDPFCGSGTTLRAAKDLGFSAIGVEWNESWCELAARRVSQEVLALA